jgi:hypothetical protein
MIGQLGFLIHVYSGHSTHFQIGGDYSKVEGESCKTGMQNKAVFSEKIFFEENYFKCCFRCDIMLRIPISQNKSLIICLSLLYINNMFVTSLY